MMLNAASYVEAQAQRCWQIFEASDAQINWACQRQELEQPRLQLDVLVGTVLLATHFRTRVQRMQETLKDLADFR